MTFFRRDAGWGVGDTGIVPEGMEVRLPAMEGFNRGFDDAEMVELGRYHT